MFNEGVVTGKFQKAMMEIVNQEVTDSIKAENSINSLMNCVVNILQSLNFAANEVTTQLLYGCKFNIESMVRKRARIPYWGKIKI